MPFDIHRVCESGHGRVPFSFPFLVLSIMSPSVVPSDAKLAKAVNYVAAQLRIAGKSVKKKKIANDDAHDKKCDEKLQKKLLQDFQDRLDTNRIYHKEKMDLLDKKSNEMKLAFDMMFELVKALDAKKDELEHNQNELGDKLLDMVMTKMKGLHGIFGSKINDVTKGVNSLNQNCTLLNGKVDKNQQSLETTFSAMEQKMKTQNDDLAQLSTTVDKLTKLDNDDYDPLAAVNAIIATFNSAVEDDIADRAFEDDLAECVATDSDSDDGSESTGSYMYDSDGKGFF